MDLDDEEILYLSKLSLWFVLMMTRGLEHNAICEGPETRTEC